MNCDVSKCKASCCYNAPLPKSYIFALKNRIVNPILELQVLDEMNQCYPITDYDPNKNKCPFLTDKCRCNIYGRRPEICKKFGNGSEPLLTCYEFAETEKEKQKIKDGYNSVLNKMKSSLAWDMASKFKK